MVRERPGRKAGGEAQHDLKNQDPYLPRCPAMKQQPLPQAAELHPPLPQNHKAAVAPPRLILEITLPHQTQL